MPLPIIITCKLEEEAVAYFNQLRQQHFPAAKNFLKAHLTLFHHLALPAADVLDTVQQNAFDIKPFTMLVQRIGFTGRGVAFVIESPELVRLHKILQQCFKVVLLPQDQHSLWPHITIQNKAPITESKALANELQKSFVPYTISATGFEIFYYSGGPWEFIADVPFKGLYK